jgi:hypothetical protein
MFDFLAIFLGRSIVTNGLELIFQLLLYCGLYKLSKSGLNIWKEVCKKLSLFLVILAAVRFIGVVNMMYIGVAIPFFIKLGLTLLIISPLISLWLDMPDLLLDLTRATRLSAQEFRLAALPPSTLHTEITDRLTASLARVEIQCAA